MLGFLRAWVERRHAIRRRWQSDARRLVELNEPTAYYEAQRLAARARANGDGGQFFHWAKVASEVARISTRAEMNLATVTQITDEEMRQADGGPSR